MKPGESYNKMKKAEAKQPPKAEPHFNQPMAPSAPEGKKLVSAKAKIDAAHELESKNPNVDWKSALNMIKSTEMDKTMQMSEGKTYNQLKKEDLEKAKIIDMKTRQTLADLPSIHTPRVSTVTPGRDAKIPGEINPGAIEHVANVLGTVKKPPHSEPNYDGIMGRVKQALHSLHGGGNAPATPEENDRRFEAGAAAAEMKMKKSECADCEGEGVVYNNADKKSGQSAPCPTCNPKGHPEAPKGAGQDVGKTEAGLSKAKEDQAVPAESRREYRKKRKDFDQDPLAQRETIVPGVSDQGIEARRSNPENHEYHRVYENAQMHATRAKEIARGIHQWLNEKNRSEKVLHGAADKIDALAAAHDANAKAMPKPNDPK